MPPNRCTTVFWLAPLLASCGAIMAPGPFLVAIDSQPTGAVVVYEGQPVGVTPCTVAMERSSSELELRRHGCHPRAVNVGRTSNGWVAGNILTLGLGMVVDVALGTHQSLLCEPVLVSLASLDQRPRAAWVRVPSTTAVGPAPICYGQVNQGTGPKPACSATAPHALGQFVCLVLEGLACHLR